MDDGTGRYLLVDSEIVPDVFLKVLEAKKLVARGLAKNYSEAAKAAGISRSTFYKYKDSIHIQDTAGSFRVCTVFVSVLDEPGQLAKLLALLCKREANILTINQNFPVDGVAAVSITARIKRTISDEKLAEDILKLPATVDVRIMTQ